ncbi:MAG: c-type cytochrome, partial [Lysobacteraceae bacterium]
MVGTIVLAVALLYGGSEWVLRQTHATLIEPIVADRSPAGLAEGGRLARIVGCRGCHSPDGTGRVLAEDFLIGRIAAPAIAPRAADYSDAELVRLIRHGVKRDGTALHVMPTQALTHLSDDDVARIIGWVRTLRPGSHDIPGTISYGPLGRFLILTGALDSKVRPNDLAPTLRPSQTGRYFARISCLACHDLHEAKPEEGAPETIIPALAEVGAAYDPKAFHTLLRTGVGMTPRDLGLMSRVAKGDLTMLTDDEI